MLAISGRERVAFLVDATVGESARNRRYRSLKLELVTFRITGQISTVFGRCKTRRWRCADQLQFELSAAQSRRRRGRRRTLATMCREMAQAGAPHLRHEPGVVLVASDYVVRIVGFGQKPGDLPIEQASKLDLIINMKTARALGVSVPESLAARANDLLE
jgi:hypothetical protein